MSPKYETNHSSSHGSESPVSHCPSDSSATGLPSQPSPLQTNSSRTNLTDLAEKNSCVELTTAQNVQSGPEWLKESIIKYSDDPLFVALLQSIQGDDDGPHTEPGSQSMRNQRPSIEDAVKKILQQSAIGDGLTKAKQNRKEADETLPLAEEMQPGPLLFTKPLRIVKTRTNCSGVSKSLTPKSTSGLSTTQSG